MPVRFLWLTIASLALSAGPPTARRGDQVDDYHGVKVADPYRWLEDSGSRETRRWIQAQNAWTEAWFRQIPNRAAIRKRLEELFNYDRTPTVAVSLDQFAGWVVRGDRIVSLRQAGLANQPVMLVRDGQAAPRVLLDPNALSKDGTVALNSWSVSHDGKWLAYALSSAGSDWQQWRVRDIGTAQDLPDRIEWGKFGRAEWDAASQGFYYTRYPQPAAGASLTGQNFFQKVFYHRLGTPQSADRLIYERPDQKDWSFTPAPTKDGRYLVIRATQGTSSRHRLFYQDLTEGGGKTRALVEDAFAAMRFLGNEGPTFYVLTDWKAPRGRVVAIDLARPDPTHWREVIAETQDTLEQAQYVQGQFVLNYLRDVSGLVRIASPPGAVRDVVLPAVSSLYLAEGSARFFSVSGFTAPDTVYDCAAGPCRPVSAGRLPFDPGRFEARQIFYASRDGTRVPMFLLHRKGLRMDGNRPVLMYAYGGFNISLTPGFRPIYIAWMERDGVVAVPNLRGGGEYGEEWHRAGMKQNKQNVFDDFIAAGEWLIANGVTVPRRLAIWGASNGGLLVGACLNQRPDLFGAAIPSVGVMDMLRFDRFTIGHAWTSEYGVPSNPEDFRTLYKYSPLHNIREGVPYPPVLIMTADHDDRVVPAHSFKYAAALQRAQAGPEPVLIRIETSAGHGAGKPTSKRIDEAADVLAFLSQTVARD